ncbi:MAG: hypothetical protein ACWA5R_00955 [bacterium]
MSNKYLSMRESKIPPGEYCYRIVPLKEGEILSKRLSQFGRNLREYTYCQGYKEVLCPYWYRTDYGTVQCRFLDLEVYEAGDEDAIDHLRAKFGEGGEFRFHSSHFLPDEIKVCDVNTDCDDE